MSPTEMVTSLLGIPTKKNGAGISGAVFRCSQTDGYFAASTARFAITLIRCAR